MAARIPDHIRLQIIALAASGHSQRQICKQVGASKGSVQRVLAAAEQPPARPPAPALHVEGGARAMVDAVVATAETIHQQALRDDPAVASRAVTDLADATAIGARVDMVEVEPGLWMTMREIRDGMIRIYQRVREVVAEAGPVHCEGCGAQLGLPSNFGSDLPAVADAPPKPEQNPALARARQTYDMAGASIDTALEDGNLRAAQRANRNRTNVARVYVREEIKDRARKAEGSFFFPASDTEKNLDEIRVRMATLAAVPLMCAACLSAHRMRQTLVRTESQTP